MRYVDAYFDAGKRRKGSVGPTACGAVIYVDGEWAQSSHEYLGITTVNVGEWSGLILALEMAREICEPGDKLRVFSDSKLVVMQINNKWRTRDHLRQFYVSAALLIREIEARYIKVSVSHIPREQNWEADRIVRILLDEVMLSLEA
jgi:ribonuclease HI